MTKSRRSTRITGKHKVRTPEEVWRNEPDLIRKFLDARPEYEQLCIEVEYILKKRIVAAGIEVASISSRAKTLNSFLEKLQRKQYDSPIEEITDFAGARVVCLYSSDIKKIAVILEKEFDIIETVDKLREMGSDQFGYGACHFIVSLGKGSTGARYDYIRGLKCEIQARTVVQDAWAILQHHLVYKRESQVPTALQRKLNSLAGLFETVDDQFERIRSEREAYVAEVRGSIHRPEAFLDTELNLDSFTEYLKWRYPERACESWNGQLRLVLDALIGANNKSLRDVDQLLQSTDKMRESIRAELTGIIKLAPDGTMPSNLEPALALGIVAPDAPKSIPFSPKYRAVLKKYRDVLKDS